MTLPNWQKSDFQVKVTLLALCEVCDYEISYFRHPTGNKWDYGGDDWLILFLQLLKCSCLTQWGRKWVRPHFPETPLLPGLIVWLASLLFIHSAWCCYVSGLIFGRSFILFFWNQRLLCCRRCGCSSSFSLHFNKCKSSCCESSHSF